MRSNRSGWRSSRFSARVMAEERWPLTSRRRFLSATWSAACLVWRSVARFSSSRMSSSELRTPSVFTSVSSVASVIWSGSATLAWRSLRWARSVLMPSMLAVYLPSRSSSDCVVSASSCLMRARTAWDSLRKARLLSTDSRMAATRLAMVSMRFCSSRISTRSSSSSFFCSTLIICSHLSRSVLSAPIPSLSIFTRLSRFVSSDATSSFSPATTSISVFTGARFSMISL
mmetsp:Transcript_4986/g.9924  ORF Transcript_4986/g.9924 Transcript_4986/m.9924 type:complete len:229 (+) Transcript_4986:1893-2579(+)